MTIEASEPDEMIEELQAAEGAGPSGKESLRSRAMRSSAWTMFSFGGNNVIRLAGNILLTHWLTPSLMGLSAMINVVIMGVHMFSDTGVRPSIVQNARGDEENFLNTAWTIAVGRGFGVWFCSALVAWPVSRFYGIPSLSYFIPAAAFTAVLDGLSSTKYMTRQRHLKLAATTIMDMSCYALQIIITALWAWHSPTMWAIIGGSLIASGIQTILTHVMLSGPRNRLFIERDSVKALFSFGRWIFISTLITFAAAQCDRLIFFKKIPLELVGVYGVALTLAGAPKEAIIKIVGPISFSVYSRLGTSRPAVAAAFRKVRGPLLICGAWCIGGIMVVGPSVVHLLYDKRYADAGWILQILSISAWFEILENTSGSALLALGKTLWLAGANAAKLLTMVILVPLAFSRHGFHGLNGFQLALGAVVLSEIARFSIMALGVTCERIGNVSIDLAVTAILAIAVAAAYLCESYVHHLTSKPIVAAIAAAAVVSVPLAPLAITGVLSLMKVRSTPAIPSGTLVAAV